MNGRLDRMARFSQQRIAQLVRGVSVRQIRLACGVVLFAYLLSHFLNHALGNISIDALATGLQYHVMFWQFLPVAITLYTAALVHAGLGIWAFYERRQFRWKAIEPLQLVLGLSIPALIIAHIVGVRLGQTLFGHEKLYSQVFYAYWVVWPYKILQMFAVLLIAWIHGCIGLYFWLRMKAFVIMCRTRACAAAGPAVPPAAFASSVTPARCRSRPSARRSCSTALARPIPRSGSRASSGPSAICRSSSCSCRI